MCAKKKKKCSDNSNLPTGDETLYSELKMLTSWEVDITWGGVVGLLQMTKGPLGV